MKHDNTIKYKPTIIAICGKSASGKDSVMRCLSDIFALKSSKANIIISDTTRPPRKLEINGINYNFLTKTEFYDKINNKRYLEYSYFNDWFYGTDKDSINYNQVNIGVFNPDGLASLVMKSNDYNLFCVYLKCGLFERLKRSFKREKKFKLEFIRRAFVDYKDFYEINSILRNIQKKYITTTDDKDPTHVANEIYFIADNLKLI